MQISVELTLSPAEAVDDALVRNMVRNGLTDVTDDSIVEMVIRRRSVDARSRVPVVNLRIDVYVDEPVPAPTSFSAALPHLDRGKSVVIIGAGPAGYFAALHLIHHGIRPIVLDRGKDVRARRRDLRAIQQFAHVDPDSNYCFGEGGAGAYSDGKLYTRSSKRGDVHHVLRMLVEHGATTAILVDAHPHIGSNKLPGVVSAMRETIESRGGQVRFGARVTDFILRDGRMIGVLVNDGEEVMGNAVIVATGHSARDIYALCQRRGVRTEFKPFALGVRAEHPQALIDEIQYKQRPRDPHLEASSYRLATQVDGRGVYSFCMCPGGLIVPAATAPQELVVNGMSMSRRDSRFANSGIVVEIRREDVQAFASYGEHCGLAFQRQVEQSVFSAKGDASQQVPAQRLVDFSEGVASSSLPDSSYIPGLRSLPVHELLPESVSRRLRTAFRVFGSSMRGYYTNDAVVTAVESRTSTPVKIPRDDVTLEHPEVGGLYPCGEGAGYAGGIVSAAMDGQRVAERIAAAWGLGTDS
ncbi:MAG: NAD(P)/FAD-dependent oxidoreductase [Candidatus Kapaibacterium sp.]